VGGESIGPPLDASHAIELRDRASPTEEPHRGRTRVWVAASAALVAVTIGSLVATRDRPSAETPVSTPTPPTPGSAQAVAVVDDRSGVEAFPVDLPALPYPNIPGPILLTGRVPTAFAWIPSGQFDTLTGVAACEPDEGRRGDPPRPPLPKGDMP